MKETEFTSTVYMHRQMRNIHGKAFGGYIMREGFEIAFIVASLFSNQTWPIFRGLSDLDFIKPTPIGSIVQFKSWVLFSDPISGYFYVQVDAEVIHNKFENDESGEQEQEQEQEQSKKINNNTNIITNTRNRTFKERSTSFVFEFQQEPSSSDTLSLPSMLPREYSEYMNYIRGLRIFKLREQQRKEEEASREE